MATKKANHMEDGMTKGKASAAKKAAKAEPIKSIKWADVEHAMAGIADSYLQYEYDQGRVLTESHRINFSELCFRICTAAGASPASNIDSKLYYQVQAFVMVRARGFYAEKLATNPTEILGLLFAAHDKLRDLGDEVTTLKEGLRDLTSQVESIVRDVRDLERRA